jgi:microcystin-dependent protein
MDEQFLGQIQQFGFPFAPRGWAFCHGQLLSISQNTALFALLGTYYGGDGVTTFALPDLRPKDEHGNLVQLNIGDIYQGKPYMETCIALQGIFPTRD